MTEINNKKRKIDDNQIKKNDLSYHSFVKSTNKKKEILPVSPNNYLNNVKQLEKNIVEEEKEKENANSNSSNSMEISHDIESNKKDVIIGIKSCILYL